MVRFVLVLFAISQSSLATITYNEATKESANEQQNDDDDAKEEEDRAQIMIKRLKRYDEQRMKILDDLFERANEQRLRNRDGSQPTIAVALERNALE